MTLNHLQLTDSCIKYNKGHGCSQSEDPRLPENAAKLLVFLPTQFVGRALVIRYKGQEVVFDWSSTPHEPLKDICWAAFLDGVEHEMLPVTSGYCLILTYNIYSAQNSPHVQEIFSKNLFYICLREGLNSPQFLHEGGCLVFSCQHAYALDKLNDEEKLNCNLKGADYEIYHTAKLLGLKAAVQPIVEGEKHFYLLPSFAQKFGRYESDGCYNNNSGGNKHLHHNYTLATLESMFKDKSNDEDEEESDSDSKPATDNKSVLPPSTACNSIVLCRSMFNPSWQDVISEITDPTHQDTAESITSRLHKSVSNIMMKYRQQSVDRVLESAGASLYDREIISRALEKVKDV